VGIYLGVGCGESGIETGSLLQEIFPAALIPKAILGIYESAFLLGRARVDRQGITLAARVMMVSLRSLSFRRVSRLIGAKAVSLIEHTSVLKILRSKVQCPTRLKPRIHGANTLDHTNVGALGGTVPRTIPIWIFFLLTLRSQLKILDLPLCLT